jgi:cobalt/nickel transport protein
MVIVLILSLIIGSRSRDTGTGSDILAIEAIYEIQPECRPWSNLIWKPSADIESWLFALQAALGAVVLGYYLGFKRGQLSRQLNRGYRQDTSD